MSRASRAAAVAWLALLASACIPLPYVAPPVKLKGGGGALMSPAAPVSAVFDFSVGVYPGQLLSEPRWWDVGAGYQLEATRFGQPRHAGFLEGAWLFPLGPTGALRGVVHAGGELLWRPSEWGGGGTVGGGLEYVTFFDRKPIDNTSTSTSGKTATVIGVSHGEGAIGVDLSSSYRQFPSGHDFTVSLGLTVRAPASAGVLLWWLWNLL